MDIIDKMSFDLKLDKAYLSFIASRSSFYYRDFTVPKRNGGRRYIAQPSPELKTLQYWVLHNILSKLPVSSAAFAYKKGDSIKKHAQLHSQSKFIFHTDIQNFFPSVSSSKLSNILRENKNIFDESDLDLEDSIQVIEKICFRNGALCIGAVSSPAISNIIMNSFDNALGEYCQVNDYIYSRYADDIYISSKKYINNDIVRFVSDELKKQGFNINYSKTKFYSSKYKRKVTGLILTCDLHVSIGTKRRLKIRKMVYDKLIHNKGNSEQILGYLSYLKDIEPNTYNNIIIKYSKYCDEDIIAALNKT